MTLVLRLPLLFTCAPVMKLVTKLQQINGRNELRILTEKIQPEIKLKHLRKYEYEYLGSRYIKSTI